MILLLETFADQLSRRANNLVIILDGSEPEALPKVRRLIHAKLGEPISLAGLATATGLSESHFFRTFKEVNKLTVNDHTIRALIAAARKELFRPAVRVSDIAFQVAFQSLSNFKRLFAKLVRCLPTKFREAELKKAKLQV